MYSVRVEPAPGNLTAPGHTMHQCKKYMVYHEGEGHNLRICMQSSDDGSAVYENVVLNDGDVAYVMNDHGVTVDVLKTQATRTKKGASKS